MYIHRYFLAHLTSKNNKYGKTGFKLRYYVLAIFTELYSHFGVHIKQLVVFTKFHI